MEHDPKSGVIAGTGVDLDISHNTARELVLAPSPLEHNWLLRAMPRGI